jgi:hypothetical protein
MSSEEGRIRATAVALPELVPADVLAAAFA